MGVDGSQGMIDVARQSELYRDLKMCMLGQEPLPEQWGNLIISSLTFIFQMLFLHIDNLIFGFRLKF